MPLDLHAVYDPSGSAAAAVVKCGTIPTGDGATVAGIPIDPAQNKAKLIYWGFESLTAKYLAEVQLQSLDQFDPINGENLNIGGSSVKLLLSKWTFLPFQKAARNLNYIQTAVGKICGFTIDHYDSMPSKETPIMGSRFPNYGMNQGNMVLSILAPTVNSTPNTMWNVYPVVQAATGSWLTAIPNGKYAILGAWVSNIANVCLVRFSHADFGSVKAGFPVMNRLDVAFSAAEDAEDEITQYLGYQFVKFGEILRKPCCPVFNVNGNATGLNVEFMSQTAEEPVISLNLAKLS